MTTDNQGATATETISAEVVAGPEPQPEPQPGPGANIGRIGANDLLALHYDHCADLDDGHALVAGKAVVIRSGLPLSQLIVVNGTCGDDVRNSYVPESEVVSNAVWGDDWLNYASDPEESVETSVQRWAQVLSNGGEVWVAEGGPADFTARVLDSLDSQFPSLDLKNVHVIQHNVGFNQNQTQRIDTVRELSDYINIGDGNSGGNGTANFREQSSFFVETALQSEFSNEWEAAFDYLDPNRRLDFSDAVEVLYIFDDTTTMTVDDFARTYLR